MYQLFDPPSLLCTEATTEWGTSEEVGQPAGGGGPILSFTSSEILRSQSKKLVICCNSYSVIIYHFYFKANSYSHEFYGKKDNPKRKKPPRPNPNIKPKVPHFFRSRPRPRGNVIKVPFMTLRDLKKRKKNVIVQWTLTTQVKI